LNFFVYNNFNKIIVFNKLMSQFMIPSVLSNNPNVRVAYLSKNGGLIATRAPNFKDREGPYHWKVSGIVDAKAGKFYFCQSDIAGFDNWTLFKGKTFSDFITPVYPDFFETMAKHVPKNKRHLIDELGNLEIKCGEFIFGMKEFIAFQKVLNLPEEQINIVLSSVVTKDGIHPYAPVDGTYKDGIAEYISKFIDFVKSDPVPLKLKFHGRTASLYGYIQFSSDAKKLFADNKIVLSDLEEELKKLLVHLKVLVVRDDEQIAEIWKWVFNNKYVPVEVSGDDKIWAGHYATVKKPDETKVSILAYLLMLICGIVDPTALNSWIEDPFSTQMETIRDAFVDKSFTDYLNEKTYTMEGGNCLGLVCEKANAIINESDKAKKAKAS